MEIIAPLEKQKLINSRTSLVKIDYFRFITPQFLLRRARARVCLITQEKFNKILEYAFLFLVSYEKSTNVNVGNNHNLQVEHDCHCEPYVSKLITFALQKNS